MKKYRFTFAVEAITYDDMSWPEGLTLEKLTKHLRWDLNDVTDGRQALVMETLAALFDPSHNVERVVRDAVIQEMGGMAEGNKRCKERDAETKRRLGNFRFVPIRETRFLSAEKVQCDACYSNYAEGPDHDVDCPAYTTEA